MSLVKSHDLLFLWIPHLNGDTYCEDSNTSQRFQAEQISDLYVWCVPQLGHSVNAVSMSELISRWFSVSAKGRVEATG